MPKPLIALDADGVLLDFHLGYADAWRRAFGAAPAERDPLAYWPMDRWQVDRLDDAGRAHFRRHFDETFWTSVPEIPGAMDACQRLPRQGTNWSASPRWSRPSKPRACATCAISAFRSSG